MKTRTLMTVTALAVLAGTVPEVESQSPARVVQAPPDLVVEVQGLSCPFCAYGLEKKFAEREEVDSVFVALEENEVRLWLAPDRELPDRAVRRTVEDAGFTPGEIRRPREEKTRTR